MSSCYVNDVPYIYEVSEGTREVRSLRKRGNTPENTYYEVEVILLVEPLSTNKTSTTSCVQELEKLRGRMSERMKVT